MPLLLVVLGELVDGPTAVAELAGGGADDFGG
jgi:hypothetical protein